jgi:hypothetical protein
MISLKEYISPEYDPMSRQSVELLAEEVHAYAGFEVVAIIINHYPKFRYMIPIRDLTHSQRKNLWTSDNEGKPVARSCFFISNDELVKAIGQERIRQLIDIYARS